MVGHEWVRGWIGDRVKKTLSIGDQGPDHTQQQGKGYLRHMSFSWRGKELSYAEDAGIVCLLSGWLVVR